MQPSLPLDLTDVHRRRLFAQEFATRLQRVGSASLHQQAIGEGWIVACIKSWPKLDDPAEKRAHKAVLRFYGWSRLALNVAALVAAVTAFGLGLFSQTSPFWIALAITGCLGAPALLLSAMAALEVDRHRPPSASSRRPPTSAVE